MMLMKTLFAITTLLLLAVSGWAQAPASVHPYDLGIDASSFASLIAAPPAANSAAEKQDLTLMHRLESERTPDQVKQAQWDDSHEDIFLYAGIVGERFTSDKLPLTSVLSARLRKTAGSVDNPLKATFARLRPYNFDHTLHPVCETNKEYSYPSGHALNGFLFAYVLSEIVPEKRDQLLARADAYAQDRVVCGVHYPEDVEASRRLAGVVVGALLTNSEFRSDLAASRKEIRQALGLK